MEKAQVIHHLLVEVSVIIGFQWFIIQPDFSILCFIESLQQTHTGAFSFTRWTHQCRHLTWLQLQRKVLKH